MILDISVNRQEKIEEGFAVDNISQRRRRITGNSKKEVEEKIKWLETLWDKENKNLTPHAQQLHRYSNPTESSTDILGSWKKQVLAETTVNFPSPPSLPESVKYDTIFQLLLLNTKLLRAYPQINSF